MTLRITLLVLVTGLFALVWTHDRPVSPSLNENPELAQSIQSTEPEWTENTEILAQVALRAVSQSEPTVVPIPVIPVDEGWMFNDCQMPLPTGIVPGEYRAVSNTGLVREFTLTIDLITTYRGTKTPFVTREMYLSETPSLRWYFIRVQTDANNVVPVIAERGTHIILPAVAQRSETKRLNQQASQLIVNAGQNLATSFFRQIRLTTAAPQKKDDAVSPRVEPTRLSLEDADKTRL